MNELAVKEQSTIVPVTKQMCDDFLFSQETKLTETQKTMFYNLAMQFSLNPFKREIYAIKYGQGFNYVTGYQVYVSRAEATGLLNGWHVEPIADDKGLLVGAQITIYRKDWNNPFVWVVSLAEFRKDQNNWKTMPEFMIKKVAIGQGFRLAFPNELGGMPYLAEEIEGITPHNGQTTKPPVTQPESKSAGDAGKPAMKDPGKPISERQKKAIYAIGKALGYADDQTIIEINGILNPTGREDYETKAGTSELTMGEAGQIIDEFQKRQEAKKKDPLS